MASQDRRNVSTVDAIYETDLDYFLTQFGLLDDFRDGRLVCFFTKAVITRDNLFGFFMHGGEVLAVSMNPQAIEEAYKLQKLDK